MWLKNNWCLYHGTVYVDIIVLSIQPLVVLLEDLCTHLMLSLSLWTPEEFAQRDPLLVKSHWGLLNPCYCCLLGAADCARLDEAVLRHVPVPDECVLVQVPICAVWHLCRQAVSFWIKWAGLYAPSSISLPQVHTTIRCAFLWRRTFKYMSKSKVITRCWSWSLLKKKYQWSNIPVSSQTPT